MVFNVGTLVRPTTRATLNNGSLPRNRYSHSDQTQQWQSSDPNGASPGNRPRGGGHHLAFGGSVHGGQSYGTFPTHLLNGPDDAGNRGNWIPTTSLDQYAATMGGWFGVSNADLHRIFPNLGNFATPSLGFL